MLGIAGLLLSAFVAPEPIPCAHAHNDYAHARPLLDALDQGFCSVEADVFLVEGELRVGHSAAELQKGRTLQSLYLDPLLARVRANHGSVYASKVQVQLLIDIKDDSEKVYAELMRILPAYREMLTKLPTGLALGSEPDTAAVQIVLSGNRPTPNPTAPGGEFMFFDGRLDDLSNVEPKNWMPLISDSFEAKFTWKGTGEIPAAERSQIRLLANKAHLRHQKFRLWAIPDNEAGWREMLDDGVDYVNTDHLAEFAAFYRQYAKSRS